MTTYFVLYLLIGFMGFLSYIAQNRFSNMKKALGWICFILVFAVLALRHQSMGIDLGYYSRYHTGYLDSFDVLGSASWSQVLATKSYLNYEYGYILLNKLVGSIWKERQFFLAVCALLSLYPIAKTAVEKSESPILSCIIYLALPVFEILYSGLRQGIAIGICFWATQYIQKKKPFRFLLLVLLACMFHKSTFVFLIAYPVYHLRLNRPLRLASILLIPLVFLFRVQLFSVLSLLFRRDAPLDHNGAVNLLILFAGIYGICSLFVSEEDTQQNGYLNLFFVCCIAQVFGNIYSTALRVGYYFIPYAILLIPGVVAQMEPRLRVVAKIAVVVFFVVFGLSKIYGSTWSLAYPYYWFWQVR